MQTKIFSRLMKKIEDETYIRYLANKYTTQPADRDDLLQILRIKQWLLRDRPGKQKILKKVAQRWYKKKKNEPKTISFEDIKYKISGGQI